MAVSTGRHFHSASRTIADGRNAASNTRESGLFAKSLIIPRSGFPFTNDHLEPAPPVATPSIVFAYRRDLYSAL